MTLCSYCHEREGVVKLTQIVGGQVETVQLCAQCAADKGIQTPSAMEDTPIGGLLAALTVEAEVAAADPAGESPVCPGCGGSLQDFRESGRLGCGRCYDTFGEPLRELLRRLHGSAHHTGRVYHAPGAPSPESVVESADQLREQLKRAIEQEQFEVAAELRDRLKERE
ncbi:MAG: UvrB/UvrC motif-containing protein [Gemmatimonadales bacterium]